MEGTVNPNMEELIEDCLGACRQLVRAVASAKLPRNGTWSPGSRAAAGQALAKLQDIVTSQGCTVSGVQKTPKDLRKILSALVEVYSISVREVAAMASAPEPDGIGSTSACTGGKPKAHTTRASTGTQPTGCSTSTSASTSTVRGGGVGSGRHGIAADTADDCVQLLVNSSSVLSHSLYVGLCCKPSAGGLEGMLAELFGDGLLQGLVDGKAVSAAMDWISDCALAAVSALLRSDALPALSRFLSAEAQRGPARALLSPSDMKSCIKLINTLVAAAAKAPGALLPADPPSLTPAAALSTAPPAPNTASASTSASITAPGGLAAASSSTSPPSPDAQPQRLGPAVVTALARHGVVEAACRVAVPLAGRGQLQGGRTRLLTEVLEVLQVMSGMADKSDRTEGGVRIPDSIMAQVMSGPCVQFTLAAHVVSQLHAVDGGATYGLPYDRLLPPLREQGETALSCTMLLAATYWWIRAYRCHYNPLPVHVLSPRGVFELCLRKAEVAADCWRRRNGLPAATEAVAAGGSVGASGSGGRSSGAAAPTAADGSAGVRGSGGRQVAGAGNGAGPAGAADAAEAEQRDGQAPPNAILDPRRCPLLALGALGLSRRLATGSVRPGQSGGGSDSEEEEADEDEDGGGSSSSSYTTCSYSSAFMDNGGEGKGGGVDDDVVAGEDRDSRSGGGGSDGDGDGDGNSGNRAAAGGGRGVAVKGRLAWVCDGGPLARRWWRAAVAAVHCGLDNMALDDVLGTSEGAGLVLDLKPVLLRMNKMLGEDTLLPATPPASIAAALDAGYLPCLERTLRSCFRACNTPAEAMEITEDLLGLPRFGWHIVLAFGEEKAAAALMVTAVKVARRVCGLHGQGQRASDALAFATLTSWLLLTTDQLLRMGKWVALKAALAKRIAEASSRLRTARRRAAGGRGRSSSRRGAGSSATSTVAPCDSLTSTGVAGALPAPAQRMLRLLSVCVPLLLPLWVQAAEVCARGRVQPGTWHMQLERAVEMMGFGLDSILLALQHGDVRAAESWRSLLPSADEVRAILGSWREQLQQQGQGNEGPGAKGAGVGEGSSSVQELFDSMEAVEGMLWVLGLDMRQPLAAQVEEGEVESGWEEENPLLGLLAPPCDAGEILPCCSNPRCAELAGDSEAAVVLRRCGGACGGAAAYCCTACQRAHWAAGHREECGRRGGS